MQYKSLLAALVLGLSLTSEVAARGHKNGGGHKSGGQNANNGAGVAAKNGTGAASGAGGNAALQLNPAAVQTGSQQDGLQASGVKAGDAAAATDAANFINFCVGKTLTNGLQVKGGSCNGIVMGDIPASTQMVSTIITNPQPGQVIAANQDFNLTCNLQNLQAGSFTNADATYYSAPQALNGQGEIVGHTHFTVQDMGGDINAAKALDASTFSFFKGVDTAADAQGNLAITVAGGLPAGTYRVCTMSSASTHQPVLMPLAQRGAQDDCSRFIVKDGGAAAGGAADASTTSTTAASAASTATGNTGNKGGNGGKNSNKGGKASGNGGNGSSGGKGTISNKGSADKGSGSKSSGKPPCKSTKQNKVRSWQS